MLPFAEILTRLLCVVVILQTNIFAVKYEEQAKSFYRLNEFESYVFTGNESMSLYLRLLRVEKDTVLVGGRSVVYTINLDDLSERRIKRIVWNATQAHVDLCKLKGRSENDCHNYIRVAGEIEQSILYVCGTNAYKPQCQKYNVSQEQPVLIQQNIEGTGKCPFDPTHNSTSIFFGGRLYSGTVTDFGGSDPVIYSEPLRTEKSDLKQLNEANFVGSISHNDYVYFFFREPAVEHINCGKVIFSRVGRVCKNDKGGPHMYGDRWTSFLKARLNCSIPGEYPFYFDEIQSISNILESEYNGVREQIIYGVFNTPTNSIAGSAICAFSMHSIIDVFNGAFKGQESMNSNWLSVSNSKIPEPRPGYCVNDSRTLQPTLVTFVKAHSLMDDAVPAFHTHPVYIKVTRQYRLSAIAVDPKVETINGEKMDVLFLGTDDGKVLKVVCVIGFNKTDVKTILSEELQVIEEGVPIRKLSIVRPTNSQPKLLIVSDTIIRSMPLQRCSMKKTCQKCIELQDPYCTWNTVLEQCGAFSKTDINRYRLIQNITSAQHKDCKSSDSEQDNDIPPYRIIDYDTQGASSCPSCGECSNVIESCAREDSHRDKIALIYITDTMGLLIVSCVLVTLIVGFAAGYLCSRHFRTDHYSNVSIRPNHQLNRLTEPTLNSEGGCAFLTPCPNNKTINLVLNATKNLNNKNSAIDGETLKKTKTTYI